MSRLLLCTLGFASAACVVDDGYVDENDVYHGSATQEIVGGTANTGDPAVVLIDLGQGLCTGTLITPKIVLTARHCVVIRNGAQETVMPPNAVRVFFGNSVAAPGTPYAVVNVNPHTTADIATLTLAQAGPTAPIPANFSDLGPQVGQPVRIVGFGVTAETAADSGVKRKGTATLSAVGPQQAQGVFAGELITSNNPQGTCYGDSGGPTFMTINGQEVVIAVTSRGTSLNGQVQPCGAGGDVAVRSDSYGDWLRQYIAANDPAPVTQPSGEGTPALGAGTNNGNQAPSGPETGGGAPLTTDGAEPGVVGDQSLVGGCQVGFTGTPGIWASLLLVGLALCGLRRRSL